MKWITRRNVKVDRVACPWLIRRFIDPKAEFLFVEERDLVAEAKRQMATPFDAPRLPEIKLNHRGERCTFEAIIQDFQLSDPVLPRLGLIVRAADVTGQGHAAPEGMGLGAIAEGFRAMGLADQQRLALQFPMYDALYEYVRAALRTSVQDRENSHER